MSSLLTITTEDLRQFTVDVVDEHLYHYTDQLLSAAVQGDAETVHTKTFTLAVGAAAILTHRSWHSIARNALTSHESLEIVERIYPELPKRTVTGWNDALDEIWQTVQYKPDAILPQDRTIFGHIELLEALRKNMANLDRKRLAKTA
jgi:hypothetical protein